MAQDREQGWHERHETVAAGHIDRLDHVNNAAYLPWIEAVVHGHWTAMATPEEFAAYDWIALRHEIDYKRPAMLGDALLVRTRVVEIRRARAWYETIISRDGLTLVEARSCWGCIDAATGGLTVIPAAAALRFLPEAA